MVKDKEAKPTEEPTFRLVGFTAIPVFGYHQTEGDPLPGHEEEEAFIDSLPLVEALAGLLGLFAVRRLGRRAES